MSLVSQLPPGPLDIVGDVHGELDALRELLGRLGYAADGAHPDGRSLVFLGDLCDRGPDSPGVLELVRGLMARGRAHCVLGNHELNLLRAAPKEGNGWFFAQDADHDQRAGRFRQCRRLPQEQREELLRFIGALPLVLERADLRVVHACWHPPAIRSLRGTARPDAFQAYRDNEARVLELIAEASDHYEAEQEEAYFRCHAEDRSRPPPRAPHFARRDELYQNGNPVRVVTSGAEQVAARPFYSTGKWRLLERVPWWETYREQVPVVFGHYWRVPAGMAQPAHKGVENLFRGYAEDAWLGPAGAAFCVDYCVGIRYVEREQGGTAAFEGRLAALRWPEAELLMDDGRRHATRPGA